jgi:hypothetical protein
MASATYDLFFTGRDDPRCCVIIGEDTKPVYLCFETSERNLVMPNLRTMVSSFGHCQDFFYSSCRFQKVYRNNKELCAKLEWSSGDQLGSATIGNRQLPMSHLILPGSTDK